jgi:hypothetical protein
MEEGRPLSAIEVYRLQRRETLTRALLAKQHRATEGRAARTLPRARLSLPLTLHWHDWETDLQTTELSARGCSFFAASEPTQEHLRFSLQLPNGVLARGLGTVVACVPSGDMHYVCVRFDCVQNDADLADAVLESLLA